VDACECERRDARERDELDDAASRRALSDMPDPSRDDWAAAGCPPAPAYRARGASKQM